jgi:hypothetical protein
MTTMAKVVENGIVFVKNKITNKIELMATPASLQVGMKDYPGALILNGDLSLSSKDVNLSSNVGVYTIPNNSTITNISTNSVTGTIYVNLPSSPRNGQISIVKDASGTCSTVNIAITSYDGSQIGSSTTKIIDSDYGAYVFIWIGNRWSTLVEPPPVVNNVSTSFQFSAASTMNNSSRYLVPGYSTSAASSTIIEVIAAGDYILKNLFIKQTPGTSSSLITYTVTVNGVDTALSKVITYLDATGNNVVDKINISKDDLIGVKIVTTTTGGDEFPIPPTNMNVSFLG